MLMTEVQKLNSLLLHLIMILGHHALFRNALLVKIPASEHSIFCAQAAHFGIEFCRIARNANALQEQEKHSLFRHQKAFDSHPCTVRTVEYARVHRMIMK